MTKIVIGPRSGMYWFPLSATEIESDFTGAAIAVIRNWAGEYLTAPHPALGRDGPVCPYAAPSMRRDLMWIGRIPGAHPWPDFVRLVLADAKDLYLGLPPTGGGAAVLRALITVFPDLHDYSLIDELHRELKTGFVELGTMLGQFYPGCAQPGLWNKDFHPLDAPIAMLVVRTMMATDFPFLVERPEWMSSYVKKFAPALPAHVRKAVVSRLIAGRGPEVPVYERESEPATAAGGGAADKPVRVAPMRAR
ncbi:DUF6875 domain-containing protein [Nocardia sp. NPDC005366]|uniref:DUF6875 domain-containing protein n=1 Tax=Nocardia sp. NPDC005366 TaxID=3156878 RepID=UPI0033B3F716